MHIDTGSSDLWLNTPQSSLCSSRQQPCDAAGTYTANSSSTYNYIGSYFNISYVDGSGASGDYATDTLRFSGTTLNDFQFGIGYVSTAPQNVLGIGYSANEVQVARSGKSPYNNLPAKLAANGQISSNAYSLWLNDLDSNTGNILFGGIDTDRFSGSLVTVPIQPIGNTYAEFLITMTGVDVGSTNIADNMALAVLLDSGTSLTYLPQTIVFAIYDAVNAMYQESDNVAFVPCSLRDQNAHMTFKFSSPASITVALNEMILEVQDNRGNELTFDNGVAACLFGMVPAGNSASVLGDTFLRSAYVVYDLDNNEISLANAKFNVTQSNIVEIAKGANAVPSATKASNPVTATLGVPAVNTNLGKSSQNDNAAGLISPSMFLVFLAAASAATLAL